MWSPETISYRLASRPRTGVAARRLLSAPLRRRLRSPNCQADLAAIAVDPIPDRLGHYLGDDLIYALNGTGSHVTPKYRLTVTLAERVQTPLVNTFSAARPRRRRSRSMPIIS